MENATNALQMAAEVMLFVLALSVSIVSFSNAKQASDNILYYQDESNYYTYTNITGKADENRVVGLETIIPTLYKYNKENYTVVFREARYNTDGTFSGWRPLEIYNTSSMTNGKIVKSNWQKSYYNSAKKEDSLAFKKYGEAGYNYIALGKIFSFDLDEETLRHEPWTGSDDRIKENIKCFLNGDTYVNPNNNTDYIKYEGFIQKYKNAKFIETIEEYQYSSKQSLDDDENGSSISGVANQKSKRMIIFTKIN